MFLDLFMQKWSEGCPQKPELSVACLDSKLWDEEHQDDKFKGN